ncbi:hypothetical protein Pcinc_026718 [Petrolisthes cinctipes]|uniref:Uncharacterized protein n=1 Tax=Petrolisthes cinctipes TaxID=88211 RepID=A0AAE1KB90_PETCI|nr:hypothetical protein Pcinc_026718 [Petrolisthes cinctipes]
MHAYRDQDRKAKAWEDKARSLNVEDVDYQHVHQVRQAGADQVWPGDEGTHREGHLDQGVLQLPTVPHRQVHNLNEQEECWLRGTPDVPGVSAWGRRRRRGPVRRRVFTVLQSSSFRVVGHVTGEGAVGQARPGRGEAAGAHSSVDYEKGRGSRGCLNDKGRPPAHFHDSWRHRCTSRHRLRVGDGYIYVGAGCIPEQHWTDATGGGEPVLQPGTRNVVTGVRDDAATGELPTLQPATVCLLHTQELGQQDTDTRET